MSVRAEVRKPRALASIVVIVVLASVTVGLAQGGPAAGYEDTFELPDGSFPAEWHWTGYSESDGRFLIDDSSFTHIDGGAVYYTRRCRDRGRNLGAYYELVVRGSNWAFAWRITSGDPTAGRCLWLSHDDSSGEWAYTFAECSWQNLSPEQYPDGSYMWHNATVLRSARHTTEGPLEGWHTIRIWETGPNAQHIEVWVLDTGYIFLDETYEYIQDGLQGFGALGGGELTPALGSLWAQWPDPVETTSWGRIKALFR